MQPLSLYSDKYTSYGNVTAEGILNQLGRPGLDLLSILVRETVQNSWDARISHETTVLFTIEKRCLTATQSDFLHHIVLAEEPAQLKLSEKLSLHNNLPVLIVSDRGTVGLNGPIRADVPDDETNSRNFVNFFFNTGQSKNNQLSGGTYGYGKSIFYRISQIHTICVYTRCISQGRPQSRFMATALQPREQKTSGYHPYTGRHWWGHLNPQDNILEPVTGPAADELAQGLGFPLFTGNETGTHCMILAPTPIDCSLNDAMHRISHIILWHCWPKMLANHTGKPPMQFAISSDGQSIPVPDPSSYPPLGGFADAMKLLKTGHQNPLAKIIPINSQRPQRHLGQLALLRFHQQDRKATNSVGPDFVLPITTVSHHVALMRNTELVVKYLEGNQLPVSKIEYAGVFIADPDIDSAFAKAEPPTHDDWNTRSMEEKDEKRLVNVALRRISEEMKNFATPQTTNTQEDELFPLGDFADELGRMLIGVAGTAAYVESSDDEHLWKKKPANTGPATPADNVFQDHPSTPTIKEQIDEQYSPFPTTIGSGDHNSNGATQSPVNGSEQQTTTLLTTDRKDQENNSRNPEQTIEGQNDQPVVAPNGVRGRAKIESPDEGQLSIRWDTPVYLTAFRVKHAFNSKFTRVEVEACILLENGEEENEPPFNKTSPEVLLWIDSTGKERSGSSAILIPSTDDGIWQVAVTLPDDALLRIKLLPAEVF